MRQVRNKRKMDATIWFITVVLFYMIFVVTPTEIGSLTLSGLLRVKFV